MENKLKEVWFDEYCKKCINYSLREDEEPCQECLCEPCNYDSHKPIKFESKE